MSSARRGSRSTVGMAILASLVSGCVGASQGGPGSDRVEQTAVDVMDEMRARYQMRDGAPPPYDSVIGLLDNTLYKRTGAPPVPLTDAVIVAKISAVEPGRGFGIEAEDAPDGTETDFEDPRALWRTVHLIVVPESVISGHVDGSAVVAGITFGPEVPFDAIEEEFRSFGRALLFLAKSDAVFDYDPGVHGTSLDGALLGLARGDGRIELPAMPKRDEARYLRGASTLDELRAAAKEPQQIILLDDSGRPLGATK